MIYIGIDPGFTGAIAHIDGALDLPAGRVMPISGTGTDREISMRGIGLHLCGLMDSTGPDSLFVCLEKAQAMKRIIKDNDGNEKEKKQGVSSAFRYGTGYGMIQGVLSTLRIPYVLVTPQSWKKVVLSGLAWKGTKKAASIQWCERRYPNYNLLRTPRCTTPHDGMADALCLAQLARLTHGQ